ncbi:MAG: DNA repair exonuclease [Clostridia bacterium]|nr:DNA repair exonuclease [Clostridia bacterium]
MIKILHCADLHLDSPLSSLDITKAELRHSDMRAAFTSLTLSAKMNKVDFLLISGDLFDGAFVSRDTIALICREFAAIPDCKIIIAPGNHDPYTQSSYYRRGEFPENVYIFDSSELSCFDFPEKNTTIYGWAFTSEHMDTCPLEGFSVEDPTRINLLVAHGELDASGSKYCPIPSKLLCECGFDYAALGHVHTYSELKQLGSGYAAYSGCLEGRGFDECGEKGAVLAAAEKDISLQFAAKFVRFCKRCYEIERLDITGAASNVDAVDKLSALISERRYGADTALRVHLTGNVAGDFKLSPKFLEERFSQLFMLEVIDETLPLLESGRLRDDPTLRGEFYRSLETMLSSNDPEVRETAAMALRCGLSALAGEEI